MVSSKTLNIKNLEKLGAERLANLLIEISKGNAVEQRRLRMELASNLSPNELAREIRKRFNTIERSQSFIDYYKIKETAIDLENQRKSIVEKIGPENPSEASNLLWQLLGLANNIYNRCDDSNGILINTFHQASEDLGLILLNVSQSSKSLADMVFAELKENNYGQYDYLINDLSSALGREGMTILKKYFQDWQNESKAISPQAERKVIGWGSKGAVYQDEIEYTRKKLTCSLALKQIALLQNDADSLIAQYDEKQKKFPRIAAEIAMVLLRANRAEEALVILDQAEEPQHYYEPDYCWENTRIAVLEGLHLILTIQAFRWQCFEKTLESSFLSEYLKNLPDFEDFEAEQKALNYVLKHPDFHRALVFLVRWQALEQASELIKARFEEIDGNIYEILTPAADDLEGIYPLAATLLRRAMIGYILKNRKTTRYRHAARHLMECDSLASVIEDFGSHDTHHVFLTCLKNQYGEIRSFWNNMY